MASVGVSEDLLLEQSWVPVCLGGVQLLAKSWFADTAYRLLLSDLQCVWEEEMDAAAIQDRAQVHYRNSGDVSVLKGSAPPRTQIC